MYSDLPSLYLELVEDGIYLNVYLPYFIQTPEVPMSQWGFKELNEQLDILFQCYLQAA